MARSTVLSALAVFLLLAALAPVATAQETEESDETRYLGDRFSIRIIGGLVNMNTDVAAGRGLGAFIDLEDVL